MLKPEQMISVRGICPISKGCNIECGSQECTVKREQVESGLSKTATHIVELQEDKGYDLDKEIEDLLNESAEWRSGLQNNMSAAVIHLSLDIMADFVKKEGHVFTDDQKSKFEEIAANLNVNYQKLMANFET